ncbi:hypothetical protein FHX08_001143 [Rhizobium sp. BK529]|nr:hypothetical protein [Rhizobium sp. BK529]TCS09246.1 hypothetical protein EV281_1011127 [Rhizobium sp. BK418]
MSHENGWRSRRTHGLFQCRNPVGKIRLVPASKQIGRELMMKG